MVENQRTTVNVLLNTMRNVEIGCGFAGALADLELQSRGIVKVVMCATSQREAVRQVFREATFLGRGLGDWPPPSLENIPQEVREVVSGLLLDEDYPNFKSQVISSLNRHDASGTFRLIDRELYLHSNLLEIVRRLLEHKISHVIFDITPHVGRDYMLFWISKRLGLEVLFFQPIPWAGLAIPKQDLDRNFQFENVIWRTERASDFFEFALKQGKGLIEGLSQGKASWVNNYQKPELEKLEQKKFAPLRKIRAFLERINVGNSVTLSGVRRPNWVQKLAATLVDRWLRIDFLNTRSQQTTPVTFGRSPFVLYALTHEPERTFFPEALPFTSQFEVIVHLASKLRPGEKLYVKEHETQYVPGRRGYSSRSLYFHELVGTLDNVEIVPSFASARELVSSADGVVSATGTICMEAALKGKAAYYFGFPWWQGFPGTTRVERFEDLQIKAEQKEVVDGAEHWIRKLIYQCIPTTSNVNFEEFPRRFALLPEGYPELELESLKVVLRDFLND